MVTGKFVLFDVVTQRLVESTSRVPQELKRRLQDLGPQ